MADGETAVFERAPAVDRAAPRGAPAAVRRTMSDDARVRRWPRAQEEFGEAARRKFEAAPSTRRCRRRPKAQISVRARRSGAAASRPGEAERSARRSTAPCCRSTSIRASLRAVGAAAARRARRHLDAERPRRTGRARLRRIKVGQPVMVRAAAFRGKEFAGTVTSIAPLVEPCRIGARGQRNVTDVDAVGGRGQAHRTRPARGRDEGRRLFPARYRLAIAGEANATYPCLRSRHRSRCRD